MAWRARSRHAQLTPLTTISSRSPNCMHTAALANPLHTLCTPSARRLHTLTLISLDHHQLAQPELEKHAHGGVSEP